MMRFIAYVVLPAIIMIWLFHHVALPFYYNNIKHYDDTWWEGTQTQRICRIPHYDNSSCFRAVVTESYDRPASITFPGGNNYVGDGDCYQASDNESFDRFCRITLYDDNAQFDILPL